MPSQESGRIKDAVLGFFSEGGSGSTFLSLVR